MNPEQITNFTSDLKKAQKTTLLLDTHPEHDALTCLEAAKSVYDDGLPQGKTNLIFIDALAEECADKFVLLDALLKELGQDLEQFNKIQSVMSAVKGLLSGGYSVAGLLTGGLPGGLDSILDNPLDYIQEKVSDWVTDQVVEKVADTVIENGKNISSSNSENHLNLSSKAQNSFIGKTLSKLDRDLTLGEVFNLTESLLIDCSIAEDESKNCAAFCGKLLVIQDPAGLDTVSMALLNHLLAVCKDQQNLPFSLSFLYLRTAPDPKEGEVAEMLTNQRTFALRYGMYETPDADYPNRLITPDLFVGRQQELATLHGEALAFYETEAPHQNFYHVVLGEPGMGKTRLVEKHHHEFRSALIDQEKAQKKENKKIVALARKKEAFTLKLKLYCDNQLSADSGLSSLIGSLEKEIDRMALAYEQHETFFSRQLSKIKDQILNKPEELIPLYKDFKKIKQALHNWRKGTAESIQQKSDQSKQLLSQERGNQKEAEFERMDHVISLLLHVVQKLKMPKRLELFIDDLQWIDEVSAEYILRLQNRSDIQVRTLATTRLSDSEAAIKGWQKHPDDNRHRLVLLQKLGYQGQSQWDAKHTIRIKPLDSQQVAQLIGMALATPRPELSNILAEEVSAFLSPDDSDSLSTLFTVETLNLLSDAKLYEGQANIKPVFEFEEGKAAFVDRTPAELKHDLQLIFNHLAKKYQASFDQELGGFNLSSYAVMEERLRLIEQHLGKRYAHLLIFSHLSSSPFEPKLIQNFIYALAEAEDLDASFREEMVTARGLIEDNELETLEEVYLLLDELERPRRHLIYGHRHRLVEIFVGAAFRRMISNLLPDSTEDEASDLEYSVRKIFHEVISSYIESQELTEKSEIGLSRPERYRLMRLLECKLINLCSLYKLNKDAWVFEYFGDLNILGSYYQLVGGHDKSVRLHKESIGLLSNTYQRDDIKWSGPYINALLLLARSLSNSGKKSDAALYLDKALRIVKPLYNADSAEWADEYIGCICQLTINYRDTNNLEKAIKINKDLRLVIGDAYTENSGLMMDTIIDSKIILAGVLLKSNRPSDALSEIKKPLEELSREFINDNERWIPRYLIALDLAGSAYSALGDYNFSVELYRKGLLIIEDRLKVDRSRWIDHYIVTANNLSNTYSSHEKYEESIALDKQSIFILEELYNENPAVWAGKLYTLYENNALSYLRVGDNCSYELIREKCLAPLRFLSESDPKSWAVQYIVRLTDVAKYHESNGFPSAFRRYEEAFNVLCSYYRGAPDCWSELYVKSLVNILVYTISNHGETDVFEFEYIEDKVNSLIESIIYHIGHFELAGADLCLNSLRGLADLFLSKRRIDYTLMLYEKACDIFFDRYKVDNINWSYYFSESLSGLGAAYANLGYLETAIEYLSSALEIKRFVCSLDGKSSTHELAEVMERLLICYEKTENISAYSSVMSELKSL